MNIQFDSCTRHKITEANTNFYVSPFKHPSRTMDVHDFIYMLDGEWKFSQNKKMYALQNDSILILSANHRHDGISPCRPNTKTMYFHVSAEPGDLCFQSDNSTETGLRSLTDVSRSHNVKKTFENIVNAKLARHEEKASILFDLLICELLEYNKQTDYSSAGEQVKNIIHKNPERFFSNKDLADRIGISLKGLETKFKAQFGITIHQYMLQFKIQQAKTDLTNFQEMPIKEIAYNLGFYDEYHFSRQFKSITGMSPRQYRCEYK